MKKIFSLGLMFVALTLMNCSKEEIATEAPAIDAAQFELFATTDDGRTVNEGWATKWYAGDQINVFHAEAGTEVYLHDTPYQDSAAHPFEIADAESGRFTGELLGGTLDEYTNYDWYLFYPYNSYMYYPNDTNSARNYVGSYYTAAQKQTGNNSTAHIAGKYYPLYGKALNVPANEVPKVQMCNATSLVEFNITNPADAASDIIITSIELTAPESIVGQYAINFVGEELVFTDIVNNSVTVTSATAKLNVENGTAIAAGESAKFYMAIKPFALAADKELTIKVTADAGTCTKTITGKASTFSAGKIKTINFGYVAPVIEEKTWSLITSVDDLMEGEYVILGQLSDNTTIGYLPNDVVSKNPAFTVTKDFDLTKNENTVAALDNMRWTLSWDATTTRWSIESKEGNYFYGINDNAGLVVGETATPIVWEIDSHPNANGTLRLKNNHLRYVGVYTNADTNVSTWRSYTDVLHSNYADGKQSELYLYYCGAITTKTQLATPTVKATAEDNTITISWDAVTGAGSYTVACDSQPDQVVTETTATFTDLGYNNPYTLKVVANPENINLHTKSAAGTASATTEKLEGTVAAYVQVSASTFAPGKYLMVYTNDSNTSGALSGISSTSTKYGMATNVEITENGILSSTTTNAYQIEIVESETKYIMKFGDSYLYHPSNKNSLATQTDTYEWSITINDDNFAIIIPSDTLRAILWNDNNPRFACYAVSGKTIGSGQYHYPTLWKLNE